MGWSDCGVDTNGRPVGYAHEATCDQSKCDVTIHRGLAYACGGHHGSGSEFCEEYFCYVHLEFNEKAGTFTCASCNNLKEIE